MERISWRIWRSKVKEALESMTQRLATSRESPRCNRGQRSFAIHLPVFVSYENSVEGMCVVERPEGKAFMTLQTTKTNIYETVEVD